MLNGAVLIAAYLLGSIPFSYLVARRFGVADVRKVGSGNVGTANVMRSAGKAAGILAFVLDFAKGSAATLLAKAVAPEGPLPAAAAAAAVIGHMFPVWLSFRGGKGVATGAGAFLAVVPAATAIGLASFAVMLPVTRYFSVSSVTGTFALALACLVLGAPRSVSIAAVGVALLIGWRHRSNFERVARGTEPRLGRTKAAPP
ncbi:MAG TPA: glycerol-3-phosphate 1-O-acyltransferase PlsY [Vicinamibacteria bacterium]|jgi:glycerol-3-phosphate acyltransferase PlsY|nr:glycerol-3-phosphate 1-O-acyltransferase PlsY [Vicinamibacteria bacterium]